MILVRTRRELAEGPDPRPITEDHYYLTSLSPREAGPEKLLRLVRRHWLIENELHHVKDRTMNEDAQQHRGGANTIARLRSLAVGLYRWIAGETVPAKQSRLRATPRIALRLLGLKRRPSNLL